MPLRLDAPARKDRRPGADHDDQPEPWTPGAPVLVVPVDGPADRAQPRSRDRPALQDPRPIEFDVRVARLDQPDGVLVESGASDPDTWRRAEPVKNPGPALPSPSRRLDDVGVLVSALVFAEPELRQGLLPFPGLRHGFRPAWLLPASRA